MSMEARKDKLKIRKAKRADLESITRIYNHAIINTTATFDTEPKTLQSQEKWFYEHAGRHPIIVAEDDGMVIGWASLSPWSDRCAYKDTAEVSVYVDNDNQGMGIGKRLLKELLQTALKKRYHTVIGRIAENNKASISLAEKAGFEYAGTLKEVGYKFGQYIDICIMQLLLK